MKMNGIGRALAPVVAFTSLAGIVYGGSILYNNHEEIETFSKRAYNDAYYGGSELLRDSGELVDKGRQELSERLKIVEERLKESQDDGTRE